MPGTQEVSEEIVKSCLILRSRMVARDLTNIYDEELLPLGLQASQFSVLASVAYMGLVRRSEIGKNLHLDTSTLTRNLRVMQLNGWIEEADDGADRRSRPVRISAAGRKLLTRTLPAWRRAQRRAAGVLGDDGAATLMRLTPHLPR